MQKFIALIIATVLSTAGAFGAVLLDNFNGNTFEFAYGSWSSQTTTHATYLEVSGTATESGGGGTNLSGISFDPNTYEVLITARLGSGNVADNFNVLLQDANDNEAFGYTFSTSLLNSSTFTTLSKPIMNWDFINSQANGTPEFDTAGVKQYQIQGDYSSSSALALDFDNLQTDEITVPEPTTLGLAGLSILLLWTTRRGRKKD